MELGKYFKAIVDVDRTQIVICNLDHIITYMNPAAIKEHAKSGGAELIGKSLMDCHQPRSQEIILKIFEWFKADKSHNIMYFEKNVKKNKDVYMVALRDDEGNLIGYYEKHELRNPESEYKIYDFYD